jgi:hypothetical protein
VAQNRLLCYIGQMTKLLDDAIDKVRGLPDAEQDEAAEMLLSVASRKAGQVRLDDETRAAVREGREQARRGGFVSDEDMVAFFERHGVRRGHV